MNPSTIYSKSGKGVQEASGKTSLLKRGDRAVLSAIDGRTSLAEVAQKVGKSLDAAFLQLINQLDKDGFVREVTAGTATTGSRTVAPKPAPPTAKTPPAARSGGGGAEDLDFTSIMPALKPGQSPASAQKASDKAAEQRAKEQESALYKARQEAERKGQAERDRDRTEMEAKARTEAEARIRAETEKKVREESSAKLKAEADAKAKAARDAAERMAAEAKAKAEADAKARIDAERLKAEAERRKADAERRAREEAERKARDEVEKARKEAEELRQRLEEERKAREAEERKRKEEEAARKRKEEEAARKRQEDEERRAREEADRAAREQEEARRREEEDRRIREKEEQARAAERKRAEDERKRAEDERRHEEEERARKSVEETKIRQPTLAAPPPPAPAPAAAEGGPGSLDALMADLDSFSQRDEQERSSRESAERSRESAERKAREEKEERKAQEESERRARAEAERRVREAESRRRKEEEERRAQEEAERRAQAEAERRVREAEEQRRIAAQEHKNKARESLAAKEAREPPAAREAPRSPLPAATDDIGVTDDDLGMDDVRQDQAVVAKESRKEQRERERETKQRQREARARAQAAAREEPVKYSRPRRPVKWGKPLAMTLFVLLLVGVGALHVVPLPMSDYEAAASEALGQPVRIGSGRLSLFTGVSLNLDGVRIGDSVKIATVRAYPRFGSLIDENKAFRRIELEGMSIPQQALGETLFAKVHGRRFSVGRIHVTKLNLAGPLPLPPLEADVVLGPDGALRTVTLRGPENLDVKLVPAGANVAFDGTASSFTLPFAPEVSLTSFAMKGTATRQGMNVAAWGGTILDGALSGTANLRWGRTWQVEGVVTVRGINAAVFAPALLSQGKAEATGKFSMSGAEPAKLASGTRIDGSFTVNKGVLGSFDLSRAIQTGGRQFAGRTQFVEMTGEGVYDRGAVSLRNIIITAGALNAGASADIAQSGALNGRIVADVKTASQSLHQTLNLGGTMREPQVRN